MYTIYGNINCKYFTYLMECIKCKLQYVGKTKTEFNLWLNNHHKDVLKLDAIPADRHFDLKEHNTHAKFTIIEQLKNINLSKKSITDNLKHENFWIKKLETLSPRGAYHELN